MKRIFLVAMFAIASLTAQAEEQKPLYVVNNRVVSEEYVSKLSPTMIESMTVLKSDSDVAMYVEMGDTSNGVIVIKLKGESDEQEVFITTDVMPTFMGGDLTTFRNWVMQNIRYPKVALEKRIQGQVVVKFVVDKEGYINLNRLNFFDKCSPILHDEVIAVMERAPRWTPGIQRGEPVAVSFVLPILFQIPEDYDGLAVIDTSAEVDAQQEAPKSEAVLRIKGEESRVDDIVVSGFTD